MLTFQVKEETLMTSLTTKKAKVTGETLVINYKLPEVLFISVNQPIIAFYKM